MGQPHYTIHPGYVDGPGVDERHYVSAGALMKLYGVPPEECVVITDESKTPARQFLHTIELRPRPDGKYAVPVE